MEINGWKIEKIVHQCGDVAFKIENENSYFCFSNDGSDKTAILLDFFESITSDNGVQILIDETKKQEVEALKAENARLQAIIDKAKDQEIEGYMVNGEFFYHIVDAKMRADYVTSHYENAEIIPLYASPIPAQQTFDVTPIMVSAGVSAMESGCHPGYSQCDRVKLILSAILEKSDQKFIKLNFADNFSLTYRFNNDPSPRITEQDVRDREIIKLLDELKNSSATLKDHINRALDETLSKLHK